MPEKAVIKDSEKISKYDFYFETSLYEPIKVENFDEDILRWEIDAYSPRNHIETTYIIKSNYTIRINNWEFKESQWGYLHDIQNFIRVELTCKRKEGDILTFFIFINKNTIVKVWQLPSLADIQFAELWKKYNEVLVPEDLRNLKRAIWLYAHWAWAGSFVYLRRIFEKLISETFNEHKEVLKITEAEFNKKRMMEKVDELKDFLPEQLIKMKAIYSILSKWVHELAEQECLKYFPPIKLSIELILDQRIEMVKKQKKDHDTHRAIEWILKELH